MLLEVVDFILTGEAVLADRCDDLDCRCENLEYDVETYLVVAGSCTSVRHSTCADVLNVLEDFESLEYSFRAYRKRKQGSSCLRRRKH